MSVVVDNALVYGRGFITRHLHRKVCIKKGNMNEEFNRITVDMFNGPLAKEVKTILSQLLQIPNPDKVSDDVLESMIYHATKDNTMFQNRDPEGQKAIKDALFNSFRLKHQKPKN